MMIGQFDGSLCGRRVIPNQSITLAAHQIINGCHHLNYLKASWSDEVSTVSISGIDG
jgi:hypothetical protein